MPNLIMPDGTAVAFPDTMAKEDIQSLVAQKFPEAFEPKGNEFTRGVLRGTQTTVSLIGEGVPAVAKGLINDAAEFIGKDAPLDSYENLKRYQKQVQQAYKDYPTRIPSFTDIKTPGDAGAYIAAKAGEQIPQLGFSLFSGGTTGLISKQAVKSLALRQGKELTEDEAIKALSKGLVLGSVASSGIQNVPESYFNLLNEGEDDATTAVITGALKTGLDSLPQIDLLKKVLGPNASDIVGDTLVKRILKESGKTAVKEGATEAAQEGLDVLATEFVKENNNLFTDENLIRIIDSGLSGAIGGAFVGAGAAPFMKGNQEQGYEDLTPEQKAEVDAKFTETVVGENPIDNSVLVPVYSPEEAVQTLNNFGVKKESLAVIDPVDIEEISDVVQNDLAPDVTTPYALKKKRRAKTKDADKLAPEAAKRRKTIKDGVRTDATFVPGDGEIVVGTEVNPPEAPPIRTPVSKLKVDDNNILEKTVSKTPKKADVKIGPKFPQSFGSPKPRYKTAKLKFPSDVEKAFYILTEKSKSKREEDFKGWLLENTNVPEEAIPQIAEKLKKQIQKIYDTNTEVDEIIVPSVDLGSASLQQTMSLPAFGNIRDDFISPTILANNLKGIALSPIAEQNYAKVVQQAQRIVSSVTGPNVKVKPFASLSDLQNNPAMGGYVANVVHLALNDSTVSSVPETAYHEAWHFLERIQAFTENELKILDNNTGLLKKYMNQDGWLRDQDFDVWMKSPAGREEFRANAFGKYAVDRTGASQDLSSLPSMFKRAFKKASNFIERLGNSLKGLGFKSAEDIFNSTIEGERISDRIDDMNYTSRIAALQRLSEINQDINNAERREEGDLEYRSIIKRAVVAANEYSQKSGKQIGFYTRYLRSFADAASSNPFLAQVYDSFKRKVSNQSNLLQSFADSFGSFNHQNKAVRHKLHELADYLKSTGQTITFDEQDRMLFNRDGKVVRIADASLSPIYRDMQKGYASILNAYEEVIRDGAWHDLGEDVLVFKDFTVEDVDAAITFLDPKEDKTKIKKLNQLSSNLKSIQSMKGKTFVPHMRFGRFGVVVNNKETGEQEAFFTVESGMFKSLYNKDQLIKLAKDLEVYASDPAKYEIIGGKGRITNPTVDNIVPFKMTHNELKNKIDPRFLNLELLSSLLANSTLDSESYDALRQELYDDILTRGFERRFEESRGIPGYSKDWDRVMHAYTTGASNFISGLSQQGEISTLETEATKLLDDKLRDKALSYIRYNSSPSEDFLRLRAFNFIWAMGGNLSSAALQTVTLPTTASGALTLYSPNLPKNFQLLGKWTAISTTFSKDLLKTAQTHNGLFYMNFNDKEKLDAMVEKGTLTRDQADFILRHSSAFRGFLVEEYSGFKPFETQSVAGSFRGKLSTTANFLGGPISVTEQLTRASTALAAYELFTTDPQALATARKVLQDDYRFQAQVANNPELPFAEHAALFAVDESHGVFGKIGRPEVFRGLGGALFFPFMTYPQQVLEVLVKNLGRGNEGRRATLMTLTAIFILSGLFGLPGFELLKELIEELEKQITGSEEDFDLLIREKIYDATGDVRFSKFVTQGVGRAYGGMDVSKRIGLPIWPQNFLMSALGLNAQSNAGQLGVAGSLVDGMSQAWNEYNNDSSLVTVGSALAPVTISNVLKAVDYAQDGVKTRSGVQLLTPEEVNHKIVAKRALGITSDEVATKREEQFARMLFERKHVTAIERFRNKAKKAATEIARARSKNDFDEVKKNQERYKEVLDEYAKYAAKNKLRPDFAAFNRSVTQAVRQRTTAKVNIKDVKKNARVPFQHVQEVLGTDSE